MADGRVRVLTEGAGPVVLWCPPTGVVPVDPDPELTGTRAVTLLGALPHCSTADLLDALRERGGGAQVVGGGDGGLRALEIAVLAPDLVGRLVMVATAVPEPVGLEPARVTAKTLLLYGAKDSAAPPSAGKWWKQRIADSRYEQVPGEGPLLIETVWRRALSHLAPGRLKRPGQG